MGEYSSVLDCFFAARDALEQRQEFLLALVGLYVNEIGCGRPCWVIRIGIRSASSAVSNSVAFRFRVVTSSVRME